MWRQIFIELFKEVKELYYALYKTQSAGTTAHGWNKGTKRFSASVEIFW